MEQHSVYLQSLLLNKNQQKVSADFLIWFSKLRKKYFNSGIWFLRKSNYQWWTKIALSGEMGGCSTLYCKKNIDESLWLSAALQAVSISLQLNCQISYTFSYTRKYTWPYIEPFSIVNTTFGQRFEPFNWLIACQTLNKNLSIRSTYGQTPIDKLINASKAALS